MLKRVFSSDHMVKVSPSIVIFTVGFLLSLYFLYYIRSILIMLFSSVILMSAVNPAVSKLEKMRIPRAIGIFFMYSMIIVFLSLAIIVIVPPLISQLQMLSKYVDLVPIQNQIRNFKFTLEEVQNLISSLGGSLNALFGVVNSAFTGVFTFMTILVMSVYLLIEREHLHKKISWFTKDKKTLKLTEEFIDSVEHQLGGWIRGQFILMVLIGVITYLGLLILGIPYALPLAILAGMLEILPNLGPTIAAVPSILLAFGYGGWVLAGVTTFFYIIVQQLENNLIVPKIMKDNVDVNPLVTILTILVGLKIGGVIGALLAVPGYIVVRTLYALWLKQR